MFWQAPSYSQPSPIEQILEKDKFTLEELLNEDDLIQEAKSLNGRLIDFLKQPAQVEQLLSYVVDPVASGTPGSAANSQASAESRRAFKYPYVACEVFCCEVEPIFNTLQESEELMAKLFSILDQPRPLDCVLAGYFSRVTYCLFMRKCPTGRVDKSANEVMDYLQSHPDVLIKMISHVETTSVAEVLLRFLGADEANLGELNASKLAWMVDTSIMDKMLEQLGPEATPDAQHNAAYILSGIAGSHFTPLAQAIAQPRFLSKLFEFAFAPSVSMLAMNVCIALLEPHAAEATPAQSPPESPSYLISRNTDAEMRGAAIKEMVAHLPHLRRIMEGESLEGRESLTQFGVLAPPLGTARLKAVEVVAALLMTGAPAADAAIVESRILDLVLQLFIRFPFNNILHHLVLNICAFVLEHGSDAVLVHLLEDCQLVQWLVNAPEEVEPLQPKGKGGSGRKIRAGYLGHLTCLANRLAEAASAREVVGGALGAYPPWGEWVEGTLRGRNEVEDTMTWSCGRPSRREVASVNSVDELDADGGLFQDPDDHDQLGAGGRYSGFNDDFDDDDYNTNLDSDGFPDPRPREVPQPNDTAAAFRQLHLDQGFSLDMSSSSSSSSDDDDAVHSRRRPPVTSMGLEDDAVVVDSDSDSDVDMDDDTVMVGLGASARVQPSDVGFSDFDDFGGFQAETRQPAPEASNATGTSQRAPVDPHTWNAFSDPTDAGWAAFPPESTANESASSPEPEVAQKAGTEYPWNAFGGSFPNVASSQEAKSPPASTEPKSREGQARDDSIHDQDTKAVLGEEAAPAESTSAVEKPADVPLEPEYSTFNYWRQPVESLIDED